jgi:membrane protein involved in colicin uptake
MAGILCLNGFLGMGITMTNESLEQRIAKQEERLKQLKAQKQAKDAREKAKQKEQDRKDDTRRKILAGSFLLKQMEDEAKKTKILADLNEYLTEDRDRKLFDLLNIEEN